MNNFQLSPALNKDTIFLVKRSELEGRFDPYFFSRNKQNKSGKYEFFNLKELAHVRKGKSITSSDVLDGSIPVIAGGQSSPYKHNISNSNGDVITVSASGAYAGYVWYHEGAIFASDCTMIYSKNTEKLSNKYIFEYLKIEQQYIYNLQQGSGQPHVYSSDLEKVKIPVPPPEIQEKIVVKMDAAYTTKKQNEEKAQRLLDSIDDYLLGELGIKLPEKKENTLQDRIFTRRLSEVSGGRFDPLFCSLNKQDRIGSYKFYKVKEIANIRKGDSITSSDISEGDIPVIAGGQKSPYSHNIANNAGDVVTVSASGAYSGYVWYHENPIFASDCTIISSKRTTDLNNRFLFECLKSEQQNIYNIQQGSGQPHVYPSDIKNIKIPLPPLKKQTEIANHITEIRNQAKQLQQHAKAKLEQAKEEVETMILR